MITTFLSLGIFVGYIVWILIKYGVPENLSSTYYLTEKSNIFTIVLAVSSILLLPEMGWLGIPIVASILGVACAPRFKEFEKVVHMYSALIAMLLAQLYVSIEGRWWLCTLILLPWWLSRKTWLFWLELICFLEIYVNEVLKQI